MSPQITNVWRCIAIFFVIIIHSTGAAEHQFLKSSDYFLYPWIVFNQAARFSVPLFLFLSGYGLAISRKNNPGLSWTGFYKRRAGRVGIPFVFWTFVLLIAFGRFYEAPAGEVLFKYFFLSGADYHFYFFIILWQGYLLFPLLWRGVRAGRGLFIFILLLVVQLVFTSPSHVIFAGFDLWRPRFPSSFFIYWLFFFYTGVWFAHRPWASDVLKSGGRLALTACGLILVVLVAEYEIWSRHFRTLIAQGGTAGPGYYNHFTRWSVAVFFLAVVWFIRTGWGNGLFLRLKLDVLGPVSFFVFLFHTWVIRLLNMTPFGWNAGLLIVGTTVVSFGAAFYLNRALPMQWKPLRLVLGLPV